MRKRDERGRIPVFSGNSLTEYALPLVILGLTLIAIIAQGNLDQRLAEFFMDTLQATDGGGGRVHIPSLGSGVKISAGSITAMPMSHQKACFQSGVCVDIPVVVGGVTPTESAGGLGGGAVKQFASVLEQLAKQLEEQDAHPTIVDLITQLASKGHSMGDKVDRAEYLLAKYGCDTGSCDSSTVSMEEFQNVSNYLYTAKSVELNEFNTNWLLVQDFLAENPHLSQQYPEIETIVSLEVEQINRTVNGIPGGCDMANCVRNEGTQSTKTYALTPKTVNMTDPQTGKTVKVTQYVQSNGKVHYYEKGGTIYQYEGGSFKPTSLTAAPQEVVVHTGDEVTGFSLSTAAIKNDGELIRQDSNTICNNGGNTGQCVQ